MRTWCCLSLLLGLLAGPLPARASCDRLIISADPAYPPLHWYDGEQLQGASIEIAKRVLRDLGIAYELRYLGPLPRVMAAAERGEIDMVVTLKKTPERERFLLYPENPVLSNPVVVFVARNRMFPFKGRDDLIGRNGGISRGNRFGDDLDDYLRRSLKIEEANTPEENFSKLRLGRIDYFITGLHTGMAYLLKRGEEGRFLVLSPPLVDTPNYLTFTRAGRCTDQLAAVDKRIATLKASGELDRLLGRAQNLWRVRPQLSTQ